jgi:hypothetical protein
MEKNSEVSWEDRWDAVVKEHSHLNLSLEKDRLPAISGVAKQIQRKIRVIGTSRVYGRVPCLWGFYGGA